MVVHYGILYSLVVGCSELAGVKLNSSSSPRCTLPLPNSLLAYRRDHPLLVSTAHTDRNIVLHSMSAYPHGGKWYQPPGSAIESVTCYGVQKVERAMRSLADLWPRSQGLGCQGLELEPKASENRSRSSLGPPPTRAKRGSCCSLLHSRRWSTPSGYIILLPSLLEALKGVIWEK